MTKYTAEDVAEARELLRRWIKPGSSVTTIHVNRSDTGQSMRLAIAHNGRVQDITRWVGRVCGYHYNENNHTVRIGGGGMDLGFLAVYELGRRLFDDDEIDPEITRGAGGNRDTGYLLQHEWF